VHAAMDISDGLSTDLGHILTQSGVGARLMADQLPSSPALRTFCQAHDFDPVQFALAGGEDYVLLCTLDPARAPTVMAAYQETFLQPLEALGEITSGHGAQLVAADGSTRPIPPTGWDHFNIPQQG